MAKSVVYSAYSLGCASVGHSALQEFGGRVRVAVMGPMQSERLLSSQWAATQELAENADVATRQQLGAKTPSPFGTVIDLFCGAGALSHGFLLEDFSIECGYDLDGACQYPFEENNGALFVQRDICDVEPSELRAQFTPGLPKVLIGCAPCQPYSRYSRGRFDPKWLLLAEFARLATAIGADIVTMENVPQLIRFNGGSLFREFVATLEAAGYTVRWKIVK